MITAMAATALIIGATAAPASAHVHASSPGAVRGSTAVVTFQVPNESDTAATTTRFKVALPDVESALTDVMPGWTAKLDRDTASGTVRSVTWTASPNRGIPVDQFALFRISMKLPDTDAVSFPASQTYSDGTVVRWDQPPLPDGGEPEHPAAQLTLAAVSADGHQVPSSTATASPHPAAVQQPKASPDNVARIFAGAALLVGALGVAIAVVRRRT